MDATVLSLALSMLVGSQSTYKNDIDGWSLEAPKAWKVGEQQGRVLLGSDTEAGLIIAWYAAGTTWEQIEQSAQTGLQDPSFTLTPSSKPEPLKVRGGRALAVDLNGMGADGVPIRAHAIGILGPKGSVAIVGVTTAEKFANIKKRVGEIAQSVSFFAPKLGAVALLRGPICRSSSGSVGTITRRMTFDGKGAVSWGSEGVFGGTFKDGSGNTTGSWGGASGNQYSPTSVGSYVVQGNQVAIRFPDSTMSCAVHFRQQDGRITELMCGDQLWGTSLCD